MSTVAIPPDDASTPIVPRCPCCHNSPHNLTCPYAPPFTCGGLAKCPICQGSVPAVEPTPPPVVPIQPEPIPPDVAVPTSEPIPPSSEPIPPSSEPITAGGTVVTLGAVSIDLARVTVDDLAAILRGVKDETLRRITARA